MILTDVNVLVHAHREDAENHAAYRDWLEGVINADEAYGMSDLVLSGFVRVVTHPRVFREPSPIAAALAFADQLLGQPHCVPVRPGPHHSPVFARLCRESGAKGNLMPDAFLAALAIEAGCEWITTDRGTSPGSAAIVRDPPDGWRAALPNEPERRRAFKGLVCTGIPANAPPHHPGRTPT